jgi:ketosteroid isomerase-like protein
MAADGSAEAEVRRAAKAWAEAIARRDVAAAEKFLGAEFSLMAPGIGEMPRARWLEALPQYVVHEYAFEDVRVHVYGDAVVMRSRYTHRATVAGADRSGSMLITDVWVNREECWQVVARHTSFVG